MHMYNYCAIVNYQSNSSNICHSCVLTMNAAVVYTVIVDSLFMRVVLTVSGTSLAELVVHMVFSRVSSVTGISGSCV